MIRKSTILLIVILHCLTPYSIMKVNVQCQRGCREWPCYCCQNPENSCDGTSVRKCKCNINDESDIQSQVTPACPLVMGFPLDRMGHIVCSNNDLTLPGYKEPPMKPPPTV